MQQPELIVIGAGAGGGAAALAAAREGLRATVVERGPAPARAATLLAAGITVVAGDGRLEGPGRVAVVTDDGRTLALAASCIVLAPGARPLALPEAPCDGSLVRPASSPAGLPGTPGTVVVAGGGPTGVETAARAARLGARVTIVEKEARLLPGAEPECGEAVARGFARLGVRVLTGTRCLGARASGAEATVRLRGVADRAESVVTAGALLVAVGRRADTARLGLDTTAAATDRQGRLLVDAMMETGERGLYAVGDAVTTPQLAHVAEREARQAIAHIAGRPLPPIRYDAVPWLLRGPLPVAWCGLGEDEARARGHRTLVGRADGALPSWAGPDAEPGFVKAVVDTETGATLGVHAAGEGAAELVAGVAATLATGQDVAHWARAGAGPLSAALLAAQHAARDGRREGAG